MSSAEDYLKRGLRQIGPVLPVRLIVELDRSVAESLFDRGRRRSRKPSAISWTARLQTEKRVTTRLKSFNP